jgi:hypothetical protein
LEVGTTCEKCVVLVYTTDCEEGNKKAIETLQQEIETNNLPTMHLLTCLPDAVHVAKSLKCSQHNWYIILRNQRACLSVVRTLRNSSSPEVKKKMRTAISDG